MRTLESPIVGSHFHPPGGLLLTLLPSQHPLIIIPEPDNPYDSNALKVISLVKDINLPEEMMLRVMSNLGPNEKAIMDSGEVQLGYIASSNNRKTCQIDGRSCPGNLELIKVFGMPTHITWSHPAVLTFSVTGQALAQITV